MLERCAGRGGMVETPIGHLPRPQDLDLAGLDVSEAALTELLSVDREQWRRRRPTSGPTCRNTARAPRRRCRRN
jgi:phosphoenolpyruvate carboxykinase (GTP)